LPGEVCQQQFLSSRPEFTKRWRLVRCYCWGCSKGDVPMAAAPLFMAVMLGGIGITCVAWPLRVVAFCRWYHLKKPKWVQELPFADLVMRPWMPTYMRIMGVCCCLFALGLVWIATTRG
jgi:hypothetical protein